LYYEGEENLSEGRGWRRVQERRSLSYITNSPSLIKGRGIQGEGYLIKTNNRGWGE